MPVSRLAPFAWRAAPRDGIAECLRANKRSFLVLGVGYSASDARVPVISKKSLNEIATLI